MREWSKAILSLSWALSLFGMRQASALLSPREAGRAADGLQAVARSAQEQLGPVTRSSFRAGDEMQRRMVDMMFGFLDLSLFNPGALLQTASDLMRRFSDTALRRAGGSRQAPTGWGPMPPPGGPAA